MKLLLVSAALLLFLWNSLPFYMLIFIALLYAIPYHDRKEHNGDGRMSIIREWRVWRFFSPVQYHMADPSQLTLTKGIKRLYILVPGTTLEALIWSVGLHGGALSFADKLTFVVPPLVLKLPVVRDFLMAIGAVTYNPSSEKPLENLILELLSSGRSVCYCPSRFATSLLQQLDVEQGRGIVSARIPDEIFAFCRAERVQLVPIVIHGEQERYAFFSWPRVAWWMLDKWDYAFPIFSLPRFWNKTRPPRLNVLFGSVIHCDEKYESTQELREHFCQWVKQSGSRGDLQIHIE